MTSLSSQAQQMPSDFIAPGQTLDSIGGDVADIAFSHPMRRRWWWAFGFSLSLVAALAASLLWLFIEGVGVWGNNVPVTWALDIVAYDWWIGIASGGLLVSALFLLLGAEWRSALNRITETVSLTAAVAAAVYPIIHLGRSWFFYWNLPYPNTLLLWPQFRSPLFWDAVDIIGYLVVTIAFWYIGMIPDFATLRDRAIERIRKNDDKGLLRAQIYGILALGWRGSALHWHRWTQAYRIIALLGVVLVVSLQTGAAVMFAGSLEPGWHDTLLPAAYLLAAIFSGVAFAAVATVLLRATFSLDALITPRHFDVLAKLLLGLGLLNLYCYATEIFGTALGGGVYDAGVLDRRLFGSQAWAFWTVVFAALLPVHVFWFAAMRRSSLALVVVGLLVALGMFADHFMVIVVTLQHDFLPSAAHRYTPSLWDIATFIGSIGMFLTLMLLAMRYLPLVSIVETKRLARIAPGRRA